MQPPGRPAESRTSSCGSPAVVVTPAVVSAVVPTPAVVVTPAVVSVPAVVPAVVPTPSCHSGGRGL